MLYRSGHIRKAAMTPNPLLAVVLFFKCCSPFYFAVGLIADFKSAHSILIPHVVCSFFSEVCRQLIATGFLKEVSFQRTLVGEGFLVGGGFWL